MLPAGYDELGSLQLIAFWFIPQLDIKLSKDGYPHLLPWLRSDDMKEAFIVLEDAYGQVTFAANGICKFYNSNKCTKPRCTCVPCTLMPDSLNISNVAKTECT